MRIASLLTGFSGVTLLVMAIGVDLEVPTGGWDFLVLVGLLGAALLLAAFALSRSVSKESS